MTKEINFGSLGIPDDQIEKIDKHLEKAQKFVFEVDPGMEESFVWLKKQLKVLPEEFAVALYDIANTNKPDQKVSYIEQGYDSCQSHRKLSKVIGEVILLGGLVYEYGLVGAEIDIKKAKEIIGSGLIIDDHQSSLLPEIAKKFGANQDFLFPGVTPSDAETGNLEEYAYAALSGKPKTSVRSVIGVGGIRFDKDWNYATDFTTFVKLKIKEDKRYYPGIGIYFAMLSSNIVPNPLTDAVKLVSKKEYEGVSVLCSAFVPSWSEMKKYQLEAGYETVELAESFHSPAYDFASLLDMFERQDFSQIGKFTAKLGNVWSFNSTIHLPWASELAGLSNDLIGSVSNGIGDWAIRYGIGWNGKSLEIREYHFGQGRKFPADLSGKVAYSLYFYPKSGSFEGQPAVSGFIPGSDFWNEVKNNGFMAAALAKIEGEETK